MSSLKLVIGFIIDMLLNKSFQIRILSTLLLFEDPFADYRLSISGVWLQDAVDT